MNNVVTIDVTASSGENIRKNFEKATASITKFDNALKRMEEHIKKMALKDYEINIAFRVQNINNLWRDIVKQPFQRWWSTSGSNYLLNEGLNIGTAIGSEISSNITKAIDLGLKNISNSIKKIPNYSAINAEGNQVMNTAYNVKRYTDGLSVFNNILKYHQRGGQLLSIQGLISSSKQYLPALGALTAFSTVESAMSDLTASFGKNDKYEKFMYQVVAAGKVAGVVTGALIGKAIGATIGSVLGPAGALIGAGIGGYLGMVSGERVKERELLKREQSRYASADLRNALADNVSDEEFKRKFNQIVTKDLKGRFSTYKLPLKEIENIAQNITMDN
ncbi:MAG: hypothetical protein Q4C69_00540, partial [Lachnoclostridium edouardi]|uniref:glycine zipper domain-containing protein n=1 Tax=Lachnoclostridium edouardi TaxID=1926283 RepID=UPI0026DD0DB0